MISECIKEQCQYEKELREPCGFLVCPDCGGRVCQKEDRRLGYTKFMFLACLDCPMETRKVEFGVDRANAEKQLRRIWKKHPNAPMSLQGSERTL